MSNATVEESLDLLEQRIQNTLVENESLMVLSQDVGNFSAFAGYLAHEIVTEWVGAVHAE